MELDVNLSREGEEPWGFRLIGGTDFKIPLTVVKVLPKSPAEIAGLQNGDTVSRIDDIIADDLSHDDARLIVDGAKSSLQLGVKRGLYDPVLDNYDPIYEDIDQIDQADIDQPLQPTEVLDTFQIQQFLDPNQDICPLEDVKQTPEFSESRSLTASPFLLPTKPYRPFSTEPLPQIPPIEDPIILNPNYKDEFGEILEGFDDLFGKYESKFKLPISEQYDPNWENKEKTILNKDSKGCVIKAKEINATNVTEVFAESINTQSINYEMKEQTVKEDVAQVENIKQEIDLKNIEMTATCIVNESIEKAKSVAEEIKKEIDVEFSDVTKVSVTESKSIVDSQLSLETESELLDTSKKTSVQKTEMKYESTQSGVTSEHEDLGIVKRKSCQLEEFKETNKHINKKKQETEVTVAKKVEKFETIDTKDHVTDERKKSTQQEVEEMIEAGSVRRKSTMFDNKDTSVDKKIKSEQDTKINQVKTDMSTTGKNVHISSNVDKKSSEAKVSSKATSSQAEHRAYTIGLKTIPNIRGTVHSSYHYNLLLQTFFLHLTDVMVALSKFILSEPVFNKLEENKQTTTQQFSSSTCETENEMVSNTHEEAVNLSKTTVAEKDVKVKDCILVQKEQIDKTVAEEKNILNSREIKKEIKTRQQLADESKSVKQLEKVKDTIINRSEAEDHNVESKTHKKAVSGLEMSQLTDKKSEELTVKMEAVISEFENKTGIEEVSDHRRRSRSRSQVVEEVMKESDPLEWLSKVDSQKAQEITEVKTCSKDIRNSIESTATKREISSVVMSAAEKKIESRHGSRPRSATPNEGKQMYVAVVESHVYTNKDTILLDQTEISETSSVIEDTNTAMESIETAATETISMEKLQIKENVDISKGKHEEGSVLISTKKDVDNIEQFVQESKTEVRVQLQEVESNKSKAETLKTIIQHLDESEVLVDQSMIVQETTNFNNENKISEVIQESQAIAKKREVETVQNYIDTQEIVMQKVNEPIIELYESKETDISEEMQKISVQEETFDMAKKGTIEIQEIVSESSVIEKEHESHGHVELAKEELDVVKEEQTLELDVSADIKIDKVEIKEIKPHIESAALKIEKEEIIEVQPSPEILESEETKVLKIEQTVDMSKGVIVESESKFVDISESSSLDSIDMRSKTAVQESTFTAKSSTQHSEATFTGTLISQSIQESSLIAKSTESNVQKLTLRTDIAQQEVLEQQSSVSSDENNNIDTPTPSTVPPTPVTDEYVFKLQIPLPKTSGTVIPLDLTPEDKEDSHIVKKKLVPHIETTLESPVIYDPPLPSPPGTNAGSPVYTKPGLRGGNIFTVRKEEILEIERRSTLLASAIDETIKSIEEYKEQVGMETKKDVEESTVTYSSKSENYSKEINSTVTLTKSESKIEDEWSNVDKQVEYNNRTLTELSKAALEETKVEAKLEHFVNGNIEGDIKLEKIENKSIEITEAMKPEIDTNDKLKGNLESIKVCEDNKIDGLKESENYSDETATSVALSTFSNGVDKCSDNENNMRNVVVDVGSVATKDEQAEITEEREDPMKGFRHVVFNPEPKNPRATGVYIDLPPQESGRPYTTPTGELLGTHQGIVDGLEEATVDDDVAKELGKPGMTEDKIAELISGESEMLREAHVMGLTRVLTSHMSRADDDSSVDFKKIKPIVESLRDSEVLKALNDELMKTKEEKKKEERKWTTFLQKPKRAVPRVKFGYHGYVLQEEQVIEAPYKVKIVKQPKPKVAPDYKPENFDTGPLPWEERALNEPPPPPVEPEDPILVPEEVPEFLEAVDPLPESEVPDLEDTGIPLPPPKSDEEITQPPPEPAEEVLPEQPQEVQEPETEPVVEEKADMENRIAEQLMSSVQSMVDPNASLEQQLAQMRAQLAALAQLPGVIQQTLELVTKQLSQITQQESIHSSQQCVKETQLCVVQNEVSESHEPTITEETDVQIEEVTENEQVEHEREVKETNETQASLTQEEMEKLRKEEEEMLEEQRRIEKQKKEMMEQMRQDQESRQVKQRPTPRVGKPKPVFGNGDQERPLVLPGGRKWRGPKDAYNDQFIAETLSAQAELIQGKTLGMSYESEILPYDERINFLKYEKPPVSLDHLQHSEVYKLVHNMDQTPLRRVDMLTPVVAEADYREKCRSISPCVGRMAEQHQEYPQQVQP